ncbi:MAG: hypothetical protein JNL10_11515 [Verrucomicrobiales bacterium]|nr:hypothetical protein [Verrucomicrobiales bacterium]
MHWFPASVFLAVLTVQAGGVYWTDRGTGQIRRMHFDGGGLVTVDLSGAVTSPGSNLRGLAVDAANNQMFWADNGSDTLRRARLDGGESVLLVGAPGGSSFPADVRPDFVHQRLYWCDRDRRTLQRVEFDGTDRRDVVVDAAPSGPYFLDVDSEGGKLYWGDFEGGAIYRSDLDGGAREVLITGNNQTRGVCVDAAGGWLYWANRDDRRIHRCPLGAFAAGTIPITSPAVETLYSGLDTPHGLVIDVPAGMLYWADTGSNVGSGLGEHSICRGDLNGARRPEVLAAGSEPWDVDLDRRCTRYAEWRARFFRRDATAEQTDPEADPDGDGRANRLEYALGSVPLRSETEAALVPGLWEEPGGARHAEFHFRRNAAADDLEFSLEEASSPDGWADLRHPSLTTTVSPLADGLEDVTVRLSEPLGSTPRFYRLSVRAR